MKRLVCPDAERPAETIYARLTWLLQHDESVLDAELEACDYRGLATAFVLGDVMDALSAERVCLYFAVEEPSAH